MNTSLNLEIHNPPCAGNHIPYKMPTSVSCTILVLILNNHVPQTLSPTRTHTYTNIRPKKYKYQHTTPSLTDSITHNNTLPLLLLSRTCKFHPYTPNLKIPQDRHQKSQLYTHTHPPFSTHAGAHYPSVHEY